MKFLEEKRGRKIEKAIEEKNSSIGKYLSGKKFTINNPTGNFNNLIRNFKDADLALLYLNNITQNLEFNQNILNNAVSIPEADKLINEIISITQQKENDISLNKALKYCYSPYYLYLLVNAGADINFKEKVPSSYHLEKILDSLSGGGDSDERDDYTESLIVYLAKEFVKRDIKDRFDNIKTNNKFYQGYTHIQSMIETAFEIGANPNDYYEESEGVNNGIFDIIAKGYNKNVSQSLIALHQQQYRKIFKILCNNKVPITETLNDKELSQSLKKLMASIEKDEILEDLNIQENNKDIRIRKRL